jgi:hypothetical protein
MGSSPTHQLGGRVFERAVTPVPHGIFELPEVLLIFLKAQRRGVAHACAFKKKGLTNEFRPKEEDMFSPKQIQFIQIISFD